MTRFLHRVIRRLRRSRVIARLKSPIRPGTARRAVVASGLFDPPWYAAEARDLPGGVEFIDHFLQVGGPAGVSPSPLFNAEWYVEQRPAARHARFGPFVDYLMTGARDGLSPHPLLDVRYYLRSRPQAAKHPLGALGDYLENGWRTGVSPHPDIDAEHWEREHPDRREPPLLILARCGGELIRRTRGTESHPRVVDHFDQVAADRLVARIRAGTRTLADQAPLVTVVMPTKDRADSVVQAVRSVMAQTYSNWQLVIADDGSTDGTAQALAPLLTDPRVEYVRRENSGGPSAARNAALAKARGTYLAYLDSDNTWVPHFLEVMVGVLRSGKVRAAYAVSELRERGGRRRVAWRAGPFDREALVERNYIDCVVVVHERSLLDEVGTFDESLRRAVDWDLWIRMSAVTDFVLVPFVATVYDAWEDRDDRITTTQPMGYRNAVVAKHLVDWPTEQARSRDPELLSVIVPATGQVDDIVVQVRRLADVTAGHWEVVVVDPAGGPECVFRMLAVQEQTPGVRLQRFSRSLPSELAINIGIARSRGRHLVMLAPGVRVEPGWETPLREALRRGAVAAQGLLLRADGTVASAGVVFSGDAAGQALLAGIPGDAPEVQAPAPRTAVSAQFLAAAADDVLAIHAFDGVFIDDLGNGDLSLRLANATGRALVYEPTATASLPLDEAGLVGGAAARSADDNRRVFAERWRGRIPTDAAGRWSSAGYDVAVDPATGRLQTRRRRDGRPPRWALKIGAPTVSRRESWGDWHFASALKAALERLGQEVVVDCREAWYRESSRDDDIVVAIRGVARYIPDPRHVNLLWVISHSEQVTPSEVRSFAHAFAASRRWATEFGARHGMSVEPLLQCVDPGRFHPVEPDPTRRHQVLFVGNARGVRPSVAAALAVGLDVAVYGLRWEGLLPARSWQGPYVPNAELPALYCSADVVLNDHWDDMKAHGFLSNRLFDLAACAARVVTDDVDGLAEVFGTAFRTYDSPSSMAAAVRHHREEGPEQILERDRVSAHVRQHHSFDVRAARLVEVARAVSPGREVQARTGT